MEIDWYTLQEIRWYTLMEIEWYTYVEIRQLLCKARRITFLLILDLAQIY
jgi:hypothetical protein